MQGTLFDTGNPVRHITPRQPKHKVAISHHQLEINHDWRAKPQYRSIGALPDYLITPECEQLEKVSQIVIRKLCRQLRRLSDSNTNEEEQGSMGKTWRLIFRTGKDTYLEYHLPGKSLTSAVEENYKTLSRFGSSWVEVLANAYYSEEIVNEAVFTYRNCLVRGVGR